MWVRGTLLIALTFSAGAIAGVTYERRAAPRHMSTMSDAHQMLMHLHEELGLDSAQNRAIAGILARHQVTVDSSWTMMQPRIHAALDSSLREIIGVLRPEQVKRMEAMVQHLHPGAALPRK